jgi:hypothetical protein
MVYIQRTYSLRGLCIVMTGLENHIRIEELPSIYQAIVKIIGLENTLRLGKELGGDQIYFPRLDFKSSPFIKARNRKILEDHKDGVKVKTIAIVHEIGQRRIYQILKKEGKEGGKWPMKSKISPSSGGKVNGQ